MRHLSFKSIFVKKVFMNVFKTKGEFMKALILSLTVLVSASAQADTIKLATVNLVCATEKGRDAIQIVSDASGASISVNGKVVHREAQLSAGTEGGPAYMQAVGGGYNITISGGDFERAFSGAPVAKGAALAWIWESATGRTSKGLCQGFFGFK